MAHSMATPELDDITQVSDGWLKKYLLSYRMGKTSDGDKRDSDQHIFSYESIARKGKEAYRTELLGNAAGEAPHADAIALIAITEDGRLLLNREFRYPLNAWCVELPAGLIDPGEDPAQAAVRELGEETGYTPVCDGGGKARMHVFRQPGFSSAGMTSETVQLVVMRVQNDPGKAHQEENERIVPFTLTREQAKEFIATNSMPLDMRAQFVIAAFAGDLGTLLQEI